MVAKKVFGQIEGEDVFLFRLSNGGVDVEITNYGCTVVSIFAPDKNGRKSNIVAGFDNLSQYAMEHPYFGCVVGRYANRIAQGRFTLDGKTWQLPLNDGVNHLHGGIQGFNRKCWRIEETIEEEDQSGVRFSYLSRDGEEGYPANVDVYVRFTVTEDDALEINYKATSDADTPFNITNHAYFNLNGGGTALHHQLHINADHYTPVSEALIPTGIEPVDGTAFDFRQHKEIGRDIEKAEEQVQIGGGYDHNFVLNKNGENELTLAARAEGDQSGIVMETYTTEPGVQLFSGNFTEDVLPNSYRTSFCLETQHFPDSPNQSNFPNTILVAGKPFESTTVYKFSKRK